MSTTNNYQGTRTAGANGSSQLPASSAPEDGRYAYTSDNTNYNGNHHTGEASDAEQQHKKKKVARFVGFVVLDFFLISLRMLQFICSVIVLGLLAYVLKGYDYRGSHKTNYGLAVAVISVVYLLLLSVLGAVLSKFLLPGLYLLFEMIMWALWLSAFVVLAKEHGSRSCGLRNTSSYNPKYGSTSSYQSSGGDYDPFTNRYTTNSYSRPCHSGKAAIAFAGLATLLFMITPVLIGINVIRPLSQRGAGQRGMWTPYSNSGYKLNPWTGLRLSDTRHSDLEGTGAGATGGTGHDQHTYSSGDSTYYGGNREKIGETDHRRNTSGATEMEQSNVGGHTNTLGNTANTGNTVNAVNTTTTYSRTDPIVTDPAPHPNTSVNRTPAVDSRI